MPAATKPDADTLQPLDPAEERQLLRSWRERASGMDGPRGLLPDAPDDPTAHRLLDAAGTAIGRGEWRQGAAILRLVVKEYPRSQEAACARSVIDRLAERPGRA